MSLNICAISGNIATDIELRHTNGKGIAVATFRIAVGHGKDRPSSFFQVVAWDTGAERIHREFKKGDTIVVTGSLIEETWVDKEGKNRSRVVVRAERHERVDRHRRSCEEVGEEGALDVVDKIESRHD